MEVRRTHKKKKILCLKPHSAKPQDIRSAGAQKDQVKDGSNKRPFLPSDCQKMIEINE